jgi:hypothetical protein
MGIKLLGQANAACGKNLGKLALGSMTLANLEAQTQTYFRKEWNGNTNLH